MNKIVTAYSSAFAPDTLSFRSMKGSESLSTLFDFEVQLVSGSSSLDLNSALGTSLTLQIQPQAGALRYLDGQIVNFEFGGRETVTSRSYIYTATVRPSLWYLTRSVNCRIFQEKSVVDIVQEVFAAYGFPVSNRLSAAYRQWGFCTQFQETDFAFVSRLMEQEGIYYYFTHQMGQHTLVLADDMSAHDALPDYATLPYLAPDQIALPEAEGVDRWKSRDHVTTGRYVVDDYDFRKPKANLQSQQANPLHDEHGSYEMYNWQLGYVNGDEGDHYSRIRLEETQSGSETAHGHTTIRAIAPGYLFTLAGCPCAVDNREYLIVGVQYLFQSGGDASGSSTSRYDFAFLAQPTSLPWRAPSTTPLPKATGPQTAVVVGPAGETIWTDQLGRVKLQFRWDRYGKSDENSSCWVRVSDAWAGSSYGSIHIPRIGQEVVVDFMNGNIDRPLVTGRVYNASQMPPFTLPASATQSGFLTRSPKGNGSNANMFRFEDKQGSEQIKLHAERNYDTSVECNTTHASAGSHSIEVGLPLASGDSSTSAPPSGAQRLLQQQAGGASGGALQQAMRSMAATKPGKGRKKWSRACFQMQQATTPGAAPKTLQEQVHNFLQGFFNPKLSGSAYSLTVNGMERTLVVGSTSKLYLGAETKVTDGTSTMMISGVETKTVEGETTTMITGLANSIVTGSRADTTVGNALGVTAGFYESFQASSVATMGSGVINVGSQVHSTGNWVQSTGSMIVNIGSSVANMAVKMGQVGYEVKF
jgi:type VI secretion system secreted protein VgrG